MFLKNYVFYLSDSEYYFSLCKLFSFFFSNRPLPDSLSASIITPYDEYSRDSRDSRDSRTKNYSKKFTSYYKEESNLHKSLSAGRLTGGASSKINKHGGARLHNGEYRRNSDDTRPGVFTWNPQAFSTPSKPPKKYAPNPPGNYRKYSNSSGDQLDHRRNSNASRSQSSGGRKHSGPSHSEGGGMSPKESHSWGGQDFFEMPGGKRRSDSFDWPGKRRSGSLDELEYNRERRRRGSSDSYSGNAMFDWTPHGGPVITLGHAPEST